MKAFKNCIIRFIVINSGEFYRFSLFWCIFDFYRILFFLNMRSVHFIWMTDKANVQQKNADTAKTPDIDLKAFQTFSLLKIKINHNNLWQTFPERLRVRKVRATDSQSLPWNISFTLFKRRHIFINIESDRLFSFIRKIQRIIYLHFYKMPNIEYRPVIKFFIWKGLNATEISKELDECW